MFQEIPGEKNGELAERGGENIPQDAVQTWKNLGSFKFIDIVRNSQIRINFEIMFTKIYLNNKDMLLYGQFENENSTDDKLEVTSASDYFSQINEVPKTQNHYKYQQEILKNDKPTLNQFTPYKVENPGALGFVVRIVNTINKQADFCIYEGQFSRKQERHGFGRSISSNGEYYIGNYNRDLKHGLGRQITIQDGLSIIKEGEWCLGQFVRNKKITRF